MPTPIAHIVLGKKIHQHFFPHLDFPSFIVGTSFPDIHGISQLNREQTHSKKIRLKDVSTKDPFLAGFQTHSLIDLIVNQFGQDKMSSISPKTNRKNSVVLSLYRDKILYSEIKNWPQIGSFFDHVYPQETAMGVSVKNIQIWHNWLQEYFKKRSIKKTLKAFFDDPSQSQSINEIIKLFKEMDQDPRIKKEISYLTENIISLVKKE